MHRVAATQPCSMILYLLLELRFARLFQYDGFQVVIMSSLTVSIAQTWLGAFSAQLGNTSGCYIKFCSVNFFKKKAKTNNQIEELYYKCNLSTIFTSADF